MKIEVDFILQLAYKKFRSVEVSTLDFDSNIPGSNPGGTNGSGSSIGRACGC